MLHEILAYDKHTNVYNTTVVTNTMVVNNVTYVNRNVSGAVTAVPQQAFAGGQPVAREAVVVTRQQLAVAPVSARIAVVPTQTAVLGVRTNAAVHVAAPPAVVLNRPVIAKSVPPPAPVSFVAKQQALAAHPGQPVPPKELQRIRPASAPTAQPLVRQVPPAKPTTAIMARPGNQPANHPPANQTSEPDRAFQLPTRNDRPVAAQPNDRPAMNPVVKRPQVTQPSEPNRPSEPAGRNDYPSVVRPVSHTVPQGTLMQDTRSSEPTRAQGAPRSQSPTPTEPPQQRTLAPAAARPPQPQQHQQPASKPQDDKKHQDAKEQRQ